VEHARLGERDVDAVLLGQGRREHLLLDAAVEGDGRPTVVVDPRGDQRVGVGELEQGGAQRGPLGRPHGLDRRLQGGRGEHRGGRAPVGAEGVADPHGGEAVQPPDLARGDRGGSHPGAAVEGLGGCDRGVTPLAEDDAVPRPHGAAEHPDVGDLLTRAAPLDLEDRARRRPLRRG